MERTYCTNDYQKLSEIFFNDLTKENTKYTIEEAIKELGIFIKGFQKNQKNRNYWVNFKPFDNPKDGPQAFANAIHNGEVNYPEKSIYLKGMTTQKNQFTALEKALYRYMDYMGMTDKEKNKIIKKIETRKNKMQ